jgi:hypothetical protein
MLSQAQREQVLKECLDGQKVTLTCGTHRWIYGQKDKQGSPVPPNFKCKQCMLVTFMGLIVNTPQEKRLETIEMLEESINHLIEAEKAGHIDKMKLMRHPKVSVNDVEIN